MLNKEFRFIKKIYFYTFKLMAQIGAKNKVIVNRNERKSHDSPWVEEQIKCG